MELHPHSWAASDSHAVCGGVQHNIRETCYQEYVIIENIIRALRVSASVVSGAANVGAEARSSAAAGTAHHRLCRGQGRGGVAAAAVVAEVPVVREAEAVALVGLLDDEGGIVATARAAMTGRDVATVVAAAASAAASVVEARARAATGGGDVVTGIGTRPGPGLGRVASDQA